MEIPPDLGVIVDYSEGAPGRAPSYFLGTEMTLGEYLEKTVERFEAAGLVFGHGTSSPVDEAIFLALETLGLSFEDTDDGCFEMKLTSAQTASLDAVMKMRIDTRKPACYLLNKAYIQGIPFYVDERVIVPRSFIGEMLFSGTVESLCNPENIRNVLDLCTGSGCLAILAAHVFPDAQIDAVDLSPDALAVARRNVETSGFKDRIALYQGDLFAPLTGKMYGLILTNPPYVDEPAMTELPPEYRAEPAMALAGGGSDGMDIVRRIIEQAPRHLNSEGGILCEVGRGQEALEKSFPQMPFLWLDTEESSGEVFWLNAGDF